MNTSPASRGASRKGAHTEEKALVEDPLGQAIAHSRATTKRLESIRGLRSTAESVDFRQSLTLEAIRLLADTLSEGNKALAHLGVLAKQDGASARQIASSQGVSVNTAISRIRDAGKEASRG